MEAEKQIKCPNCLSPVAADVDSCPHCKSEFYNCSNCNSIVLETDTVCKNCNTSLDTNKVKKPKNEIFNTLPLYEYKPLGVITNTLLALIVAGIFFSIIDIYRYKNDIAFLNENLESGANLYYNQDDHYGSVMMISQILSLITLLGSVIFYFFWILRAYRNLHSLQFKPTEYRTGWAIGSYFVPFLNYFRPYQIMKEIWFGSQPDYKLLDEDVFDLHKRRSSTSILTSWWTAFLIEWHIAQYSLRYSMKVESTQQMVISCWLDIISSITGIIVAFISLYLIKSINDWQVEKFKNKLLREC